MNFLLIGIGTLIIVLVVAHSERLERRDPTYWANKKRVRRDRLGYALGVLVGVFFIASGIALIAKLIP